MPPNDMSGQDLFNEIQSEIKTMDVMISEMRKRGRDLAEAESEYKIKLRQEILALREEGTAVTLIQQICYGIPEIARLRIKRDIAQTLYETVREAIQTQKLKIRILENQLDREHRG